MSREAGKVLESTWMADPVRRAWVNRLVSERLDRHLQARRDLEGKEVIPPQTVTALCQDLEGASQARLWFLATCTCALLAELLYGSETGGTFLANDEDRRQKKAWKRAGKTGLDTLRNGLRSLRNACFHPAHVIPDAGSGIPHAENLAEALRRWGEQQIADVLERNYSFLRTSEVYVVALRMLDAIGQDLLTSKGHPPFASTRPG